MDKQPIKFIIASMLLTFVVSKPAVIFAEDTGPPVVSQIIQQSNVTQFQNWIKTNENNNRTENNLIVLPSPPPLIINKPDTNSNDSPIIESKPLTFSESQQVMLNSAPPSAPPSEEANIAFNNMMQKNM